MNENDISYGIRGSIYDVFNTFGPGLFESIYVAALKLDLERKGFEVKQEVPIPVFYNEQQLGVGFRLDLLVENKVIIEVKSISTFAEVHHKHLITYLKLAKKKLGILVNFNEQNINEGLFRKVNKL